MSSHQRHADHGKDGYNKSREESGVKQKHSYTPSKAYQPPNSEHTQAPDPGKGEVYTTRSRKENKAVTLGRHVTSRDGFAASAERRAHVVAEKKKQEKIWDSHRRTSSAEHRVNSENADVLPK